VSYILNIDTAVTTASVCLAKDNQSLGLQLNPSQKDQAAWLHTAIRALIREAEIPLQQLDAIAVSAGPGSYTGLRVGMAAGKGLCYALKKPLIAVNTLQMMAVAAQGEPTELLCPMIDARRMEVFTALYDQSLNEKLSPVNIILDELSFRDVLSLHTVSFFGNGSEKYKNFPHNVNAYFKKIEADAKNMIPLSFNQFKRGELVNLAYSEPNYGKEFYSAYVKPS